MRGWVEQMRVQERVRSVKTRKMQVSRKTSAVMPTPIRVVAKNGQISLGKKFAGKQIQIFQQDDTTLIIKTVVVIPESELWLYKADNMNKIDKSIEWVESNPRRDNFDEIIEKIEHVKG